MNRRGNGAGRLYVCATPIGNLEDVSLRLLRILRDADVVLAEDTRRTRRLTERYEIAAPLRSCREGNEEDCARELVERLGRGEKVALVSDAGTPGIADPGPALVRAARAGGYPVIPVPGPSAATTAISVSGFPADAFLALGFLPRGGRRRREALERIALERIPVILFEAPHRIEATLADLEAFLDAGRAVWVGRELTKEHESHYFGPAGEARRRVLEDPRRGEYTIVIGPETRPGEESRTEAEVPVSTLREEIRLLLEAGLTRKESIRRVARAHGLSRQAVYRVATGLDA